MPEFRRWSSSLRMAFLRSLYSCRPACSCSFSSSWCKKAGTRSFSLQPRDPRSPTCSQRVPNHTAASAGSSHHPLLALCTLLLWLTALETRTTGLTPATVPPPLSFLPSLRVSEANSWRSQECCHRLCGCPLRRWEATINRPLHPMESILLVQG